MEKEIYDIISLEEEQFDIEVLLGEKKESGEKACKLINYITYNNDMIDAEIKRLQDLKKSNSNKIESVKKYLLNIMNIFNLKDLGLYKLSTRKSTSIEIDDIPVDNIPVEFINEKVVKTISKEKIKEFLNSPEMINQETGEVIPNTLDWARLKENVNLVIK